MSNVSTFGTFTMARMGIYAAQKGISVTGNNIANINTQGYSRQAIDQSSLNMGGADRYVSKMDTRIGAGAMVWGIEQLRDPYLDIRYRNELGNVGSADGMLYGLDQIAVVLDEVGRGDDEAGVLEAKFNELITQMQKLDAQGAGKDEFDTLVRSAASSLTSQINTYANQLATLKQTQAEGFRQDLKAANLVLEKIRDMNTSIRKTQLYGGNALEQIDERNNLLDELADYVKVDISYEKEMMGEDFWVDKLVVKTANEPQRTLISGIYATQLSIKQEEGIDKNGNLYTYDSPYYDLSTEPLRDSLGRSLILSKEDQGGATISKSPGQAWEPSVDEDAVFYMQPAEEKSVVDDDVVAHNGGFATLADYTAAYESDISWRKNPLEYWYEAEPYTQDGASYFRVKSYALEYANNTVKLGEEAGYVTLVPVTTYSYNISKTATPTSYQSKKEAEEDCAVLNSLRPETELAQWDNGNKYSFEYQVVPKDGSFTIHKYKVFKGESQLEDTELYGRLQSEREVLTKKGVFSTNEDLTRDLNSAAKRGIPFYQKALDVLASTFASVLNEANTRYGGGVLFSSDSNTNDPSGITAANISVSKNWANGSFRIVASSNDKQSTGSDNLGAILELMWGEHEFKPTVADDDPEKPASTEVFFTGSFQELFTTHMAGALAKDQALYQSMLRNYETTADELYVDRDAVMGVDLNDEAMDMMMFQKAYSAACRLMTTYDEMLEKLINGT